LGEHDKAIQDLQRVEHSLAVSSAELDAALAEAYFGAGERDLASQYCQAARRKTTDADSAVYRRIERLEALLENKEDPNT